MKKILAISISLVLLCCLCFTGCNIESGRSSANQRETAYDRAVKNGFKGTEEEWLRQMFSENSDHEHNFVVSYSGDLCDKESFTVYSCDCGMELRVRNYMDHVYVDGKCIYCGQSSGEDPTQHKHNYVPHHYGNVCEEGGYTEYECECGESYRVEGSESHVYVEGKCIYCGQSSGEEPTQHKHNYVPHHYGNVCEEGGYTEYECECGESYRVEGSESHVYVEGKCIYCGQSSGEEPTPHKHNYIPHQYGNVCEEGSYTEYECECGESYRVKGSESHVYVEGKCIYCGKEAVASLKGKVFETDYTLASFGDEPLSEVSIQISGSEFSTTTSSGYNGEFELSNIPLGEYTVTFTKYGFVDLSLSINLQSNKEMNVFMDAQQNSKLEGRVTIADSDMNTENNSPLEDAKVLLQKLSGSDKYDRTDFTDTSGEYSFENLAAGYYKITITKQGYVTIEQFLYIGVDEARRQNMVMEMVSEDESGQLGGASGMIYDAAVQGNVGVEGLTLRFRKGLDNTNMGEPVKTATTGSNGRYSVEGLEPGNYTVTITDERELDDEDLRYGETSFSVKVLPGITIDNQNGYVSNNVITGQIRIVLSWGSNPSDLDSHLTGPTSNGNRFHTYFPDSSKTYFEGGETYVQLDRDDRDQFGPETTTIYVRNEGTYRFSVHDYSNRDRSNSNVLASSGAKVEVYFGEVLRQTYYVPNSAGTLWTVFEYDSTQNKIISINTMSYESTPENIK